MKQFLFCLFLTVSSSYTILSQTQLHIENGQDPTEPVALIEVNNTSSPSIGLKIELEDGQVAAPHNGIRILSANGRGIFASGLYTAGLFHSSIGTALESKTFGSAPNSYGLVGVSVDEDAGGGILGIAHGNVGSGSGVKGISNSNQGTGIYGLADDENGSNFGVRGISKSANGTGVYGFVDADNTLVVKPNGVHGEVNSLGGSGVFGQNSLGAGVFGWSTGHSGSTYGVRGQSDSDDGIGVYGYTTSDAGETIGVKGLSGSHLGIGVYGEADLGIGNLIGVKGIAKSSYGTGVYGEAEFQPSNNGDIAYGVHGKANTTSGAGVYGENNLGPAVLGLANENGIGVKGQGDKKFGGKFTSNLEYGLYAEGENKAGGYFIGGIDVNGIESDLVLGVEGTADATDNGVISSDLSSASSDFHIMANDQFIVKLDNDRDEDSYMQVLNGDDDKIFTLEENGDLEIQGALEEMSDRHRKHDIQFIGYNEILDKLATLEIYKWKYKGQKKVHLGPMAQDFYKVFGLNDSDTRIAGIDTNGVALASIKALYQLVLEQQEEIEVLKAKIEN